MVKYTTTSLIELLSKFPKDLQIETDLAFMWNYPEELKQWADDNDIDINTDENFFDMTIEHATDLCIFEGSWQKGNVSDVDGKYGKFFKDIKEDINERKNKES